MTGSRILAVCGFAVVAWLVNGAASAAPVLFYTPPVSAPPTQNEGAGNSRDTHFGVTGIDAVNLYQFGVLMDPLNDTEVVGGTVDGSITVIWRIFGSDSEGRVFAPIFESAPKTFADAGPADYNRHVNVSLSAGSYYVLSMQVVTGAFAFPALAESGQGLPLTVSGGPFTVINGGQNIANTLPANYGKFGNWNNLYLPAFSVRIPEPKSLALLAGGIMLLVRWRR